MTTDKRTDKEMNEIIAKWLGWEHDDQWPRCPWKSPTALTDGGESYFRDVPNLCEDLNALNTAIYSNYSEDIADFYAMRLWEIVNPDVGLETCSSTELLSFCNATARDRAEALVRVIELNKPTTT